jgi:hypothetical protein
MQKPLGGLSLLAVSATKSMMKPVVKYKRRFSQNYI